MASAKMNVCGSQASGLSHCSVRRTAVLDPSLQVGLSERPTGRAIMRQSWRDLLFLHFACDPMEVQEMLPKGLTVDTYPNAAGVEQAWIGLVPFLMKDVRIPPLPLIPGTHAFPETNVRTYVHCGGRDPGVWFFSLDAANRLAVMIARAAFGLPYFHSHASHVREVERIAYRGARPEASYEITIRLGSELPRPLPGTLEHFLVERYLLYTERRGRLRCGRVHHLPYTLREARIELLEESLVRSSGLTSKPFTHIVFSEGVDVEVFALGPTLQVQNR